MEILAKGLGALADIDHHIKYLIHHVILYEKPEATTHDLIEGKLSRNVRKLRVLSGIRLASST